MNKKFIFILSMVLIALLTTASLSAQAQARRARILPQNLRFGLYMAEQNLFEARMLLRFKDEIGLTPEQEKKIENMMLAYEEIAIRRQADIKILETKFAALLNDQKVNRKEMEKMARDIGKLKTDNQIDHLNYLLDVRETLTVDQIQKLENMRKEMRKGMRERFMEKRQGRLTPPPAKEG